VWRLGADVWCIVVVIVVLGACATARMSPEDLSARGQREVEALLKRVSVYEEPGLREYLAGVAARVGGAGANVTVIADPTLAAFAMPGGRVFVHSGLLSAMESEAELALVLARELAHDLTRLIPGPRRAPMSTVAMGPTAAALFGLDLRLAIAAAIDGYGSAGERAADAEAGRRLAAAGYDAREGARLFTRLAAADADRGGLAEVFVYGDRGRMGERDQTWGALTGTDSSSRAAAANPRDFAVRVRRLVRDNAALDARAGRLALASRQLERVLAADPDDPVALCHDGEVLRLRGQLSDGPERTDATRRAIERYRRAVELDPRYAEPFRQLGLLYYDVGDRVQARQAFERYLALEGSTSDTRRIREYLAVLGQ
jgi:beta-barrel assembly-enhancing protease